MKITKEYLKHIIKEELQKEIFGLGEKPTVQAAITSNLEYIKGNIKKIGYGNLIALLGLFDKVGQLNFTSEQSQQLGKLTSADPKLKDSILNFLRHSSKSIDEYIKNKQAVRDIISAAAKELKK